MVSIVNFFILLICVFTSSVRAIDADLKGEFRALVVDPSDKAQAMRCAMALRRSLDGNRDKALNSIYDELEKNRVNPVQLALLRAALLDFGADEVFVDLFLEEIQGGEIPVSKLRHLKFITMKFAKFEKTEELEAFGLAQADFVQFWAYRLMPKWFDRIENDPDQNPFFYSREADCAEVERIVLKSGRTLCLNMPALAISAIDIRAAIKKLNARAGRKLFDLPTEKQYDHATGVSQKTKYPFGLKNKKELLKLAWLRENSNGRHHVVGSASGYREDQYHGLADFIGNNWKWMKDSKRSSQGFRGGSCFSSGSFLSSGFRGLYPRGIRCNYVGARLSRRSIPY